MASWTAYDLTTIRQPATSLAPQAQSIISIEGEGPTSDASGVRCQPAAGSL